ncbi:helix-turn-helix transcriptional regulator [Actinophytocola gossypii]|uniref:AAA family ATPase n=1 Tax=Actinophytocola gossypii TaxID=2812003 RepID=A0ABT2JID1_9PSEU|nr:LuxR family transcriptional regulator [Actinophytocola gossypii]MCT2587647.1 AAA family ATPase [Actinophytocola gossypii]
MVVERDRELETLRGLLAEAVGGSGRAALVVGGLASGKTELLAAFAEEVVSGDTLLLTASGAQVERELPMGVMWQLFRSAPLPKELLDRVSELITWDAAALGRRPEADARAVHGLCALLLELAAERPLVLTVDDLQHVDSASLRVLLSLRRRMRSARVLLVLAEWERPSMTRTVPHAELVRQPHRRIPVAPLTPAGVGALAERRLGGADQAAALHELAGGNPLLTNALIEDRLRGAEPVGAVFRQDVLDCLDRWHDPDITAVARGVAVLDEHATPDLVGRLLELPDRAVAPVFDVLRAAGLMTGNRLRHQVIVATVLESAEPDRLHLRAAELLYGRGVDATEIARHLVAADDVPGPWAVGLLRRASDRSVVVDDRFAVACLELALRVCDEPDRVAVRAALVRVAWRVNPSAVAPQVPALRSALDAGELGWRDAVPVVRHLLWQGDLPAAADQLRAVRAACGGPDADVAAELRFAHEWIYGALPEDVRSLLEPDRAVPPATTSPLARTPNLLSRGADAVSGAEHILQGCLGDVLPEVGAMAVLALDHADRQDRARYWSDALADDAERRRATTWSALLGCVRAELSWRRGDLASAAAGARAALDRLHPQSWGVLVGLPLSTEVLALTAMGRLGAAAELLEQVVPDAMAGTVFGARYLHASGSHSLAAGRPLAAVDEFERCGALLRSTGFDVPAMVPWRSDLGHAYLTVGMRKRARELAMEQLDRAGSGVGARTRAMSLRVLAGASDPRNRASILREAIQLLEKCGDRLELARALTDLSQVHREVGELAEARLVLRRAEQELKACRAVVPDREPRREPRPEPGPAVQARQERAPEPAASGVSALSEAERNVAALAALGHTNREIGRTLYITVSTVEQHLTRVYRKLKVSRRTDLPSELSHRVVLV